ncbi:MAG: ATP-dependent sacrificial sulfur transferase LarE [Gammaproteobacteria bacterium]|nr:ATP-dependent sacrificial sulfur transferase LarE [Gammaproteobacteria bacterium]
MDAALAEKYQLLNDYLGQFESSIVAFSGGVDSSLVAYVAAQKLGNRALAITSGSASLKRSDLKLTVDLARKWGIEHRVIVTDELSKADYRANPINRCFHCKTSLYVALAQIARSDGYEKVLNGTNCDDLGDHRPGLEAAKIHQVGAPLVEAGFRKTDVRSLAAHLGLENAEKPQAACLSSRFPYGTHIDEAKLAQVERAEDAIAGFGFSQFRVRHHGDVARLELLPEEFTLALDNRGEIETAIKACGYRFVALDLGGFRSGSLNDGIVKVVNLPA